MPLLHIFDHTDARIRETVAARGSVQTLALDSAQELAPALDALVNQKAVFDRILFETHGSPGMIYFGQESIGANYWRACSQNRNYSSLTSMNSRIYFNGCNVAEGDSGWEFLDAAACVFLNKGGGCCFGQTSLGFGNPFNGHVVHLWGDTRKVYISTDGRVLSHQD